jgi:hypothetical protein
VTNVKWVFGDDVNQEDPLVGQRIPVVNSAYPSWKYIAAFLSTGEHSNIDPPWPLASKERPTDDEAKMISSFIQCYIQHWFNDRYQRKLAQHPLDVDGGSNTTVFIKYGADDWGYRRCSWEYGPVFVPAPPGAPNRAETGGRHTLEQVMDRCHAVASKPMQYWIDWKAAHPDTFPK